MSAALVENLRAAKGELARRVVDEMFADPFWLARFPDRGRKHSEQDLVFHVDYLVQALVAHDELVLEQYARWLQSVLTTRGMCTLHLDESFERLGRVIAETIADSQDACSYLASARGALRYPEGSPARAVQDSDLAERAAGESVATIVSYLADAIALERPSIFAAHVDWLRRSRGDVDAILDRLRSANAVALPDPARLAVATVLR